MVSCTEADKKADGNATTSNTSQSSPDTANAISKASNHPHAAATPVDSANFTTIEWLGGTTKDFGSMKQGETLEVSFKFKNNGTKPLIISDVTASCGCTVPEKPKKPFAPGETGVIKASFDSNRGQVGHNSKQVTVISNTNPQATTLVFSVDVKAKS